MAQRVGRGIALLFYDRGTRRGWVVSSTPQPHFTLGKDPVPILQEAGWAPGPVWTGGKSRPHWDSIPERPARSSVTIPTELPNLLIDLEWAFYIHYIFKLNPWYVIIPNYKRLSPVFRQTVPPSCFIQQMVSVSSYFYSTLHRTLTL